MNAAYIIVFAVYSCVHAADTSCAVDDVSCQTASDEVGLLAISRTVSSGMSALPSFASFVAQQGRTYITGSQEYKKRRAIYQNRLVELLEHNKNENRRWSKGVNHLSDKTEEELAQLRGLRARAREVDASGGPSMALTQLDAASAPTEKDWTHLQGVKADIDQSACGSCWAFATMTLLRANAEIKGHNRTFSAQEIVACTPNPHHCGGKGGCDGSTIELAMNYVMEEGLDTEEGTPYDMSNKCNNARVAKQSVALIDGHGNGNDQHYSHAELLRMTAVGVHTALKTQSSRGLALGLQSWERLPMNKYAPLLLAVAQTGPVGISVAAQPWSGYQSGVFDGCSKDAVIDHAVTLIGYGTDATTGDKFWRIKNSWTNSWGEDGNIRMLRHEGEGQHCGIDHQPKMGTACDGDPATVPVCGMCGILFDSVVPHFNKA